MVDIQQLLQSCTKKEITKILQNCGVSNYRPRQTKSQLIEITLSLKDNDILEHVPTNKIRDFLESFVEIELGVGIPLSQNGITNRKHQIMLEIKTLNF